MKRLLAVILTAAAAMLLPLKAPHAAPVLTGAVGVNGVWLSGQAVDFTKDFEGAATLSASLSPHISGVAHVFYGFSGNYVRYDGGARITATDTENPDFNLYLGILYRDGSTSAVKPAEWAPDAGVGWKPNPKAWPHVIIGADAAVGLESKNVVSYAALRWQF